MKLYIESDVKRRTEYRAEYVKMYGDDLLRKLPQWERKYEKILGKRNVQQLEEEKSWNILCDLLELDPSYKLPE